MTTKQKPEVKNSRFLKDNKLDKVLLSKSFFEKTKSGGTKIPLSKETLDNFRRVFNEIGSLL